MPYPYTAADILVPFEDLLNNVVESSLLVDTGWQPVSGVATFASAAVQVRKIGKVVYLSGYITRPTGFSLAYIKAFGLPAGFAPSQSEYVQTGSPQNGVAIRTGGYVDTVGQYMVSMTADNPNAIIVGGISWIAA